MSPLSSWAVLRHVAGPPTHCPHAQAKQLTSSDRCSLFLVKKRESELEAHFGGDVVVRMPLTMGIAGAVAASGNTVKIDDAYADERFNKQIDLQTGYFLSLAMLHCVLRLCDVVWCGVVWCSVVWCGVVWCGVVCCVVLCCVVLCCVVLCCVVLCCVVLWFRVLKQHATGPLHQNWLPNTLFFFQADCCCDARTRK